MFNNSTHIGHNKFAVLVDKSGKTNRTLRTNEQYRHLRFARRRPGLPALLEPSA